VLRAWFGVVSSANRLLEAPTLPHLPQFQNDFEELSRNISAVCWRNAIRAYHRDSLFLAAKTLARQITAAYHRIYTAFSGEKADVAPLKRDVQALSREIEEDFLALFPAAAVTTPEMNRRRAQMRAACGDVIALLETADGYRGILKKLLNQMAVLQREIVVIRDRLGIESEVIVAPIESPEEELREENLESTEETPEQRMESFIEGVSQILRIDTARVKDPITRMNLVESSLKKFLTAPLSRLDVSPPREKRKRRSNLGGTPTVSLWEERERVASQLERRRARTIRSVAVSRLRRQTKRGFTTAPPPGTPRALSPHSSDED
jgi:hypothetical protein